MSQGGLRLPPEVVEEARKIPEWQADMVGIGAGVSAEHDARMVVLVVTAGEFVIWTDVRTVRAAEIPEVAAALEEAVEGAAAAIGVLPDEVLVRHEEVAQLLAPRLLEKGCDVGSVSRLPDLDPLIASLSEHLTGEPGWPAVPPPATWAAWFLPVTTSTLSGGVRPARRSTVFCNRLLCPVKARSCLGRWARLAGQNRVPEPPAIITL
jgi:hypothetical protein